MDQIEKDVLKGCLDCLTALNIYHWRNNTGAVKSGSRFIKYGFKGSADILGICPDGRFLAVECKRTTGGKLSPEQKTFLEKITQNKGVSIVANSVQAMVEQLRQNGVI